jgi:hypothetical protein
MSDDRIPTTLDFVFKVDGKNLLSAKCELSIQGHGSANYPKKGYTFDPINANGDAIEIKFGDMPAADSFHLKAYYTDRTQSRGIAGPRLWRKMIESLPAPYNKFNNIPLDISDGQSIDAICHADAKYSEDGFPVSFYLNDAFYGLYTIKLKKSRGNYAMVKNIKTEIFLDCLGYDERPGHSAKLSDTFDYAAWELRNPKISGYDAGQPITDAAVLANINRLFGFTSDLANQYANWEDYIVLPHWICWVVFSELIGNTDVDGNNLELTTWDGTHWSLLPYDLDNCLGVGGSSTIYTQQTGYLLPSSFYSTFKSVYETEIKQLYTQWRNSGLIETGNIFKIYTDQVNNIPRGVYEKERQLWPATLWTNGYPILEQIYTYLKSRIDYLDSVWLLS